MKILYVTAMNETINAFLIPHINMLVNKGNEVHCACNINREIDNSLTEKNVIYNNICFSRNPLKIKYRQVICEIKQLYRKNKYDMVHVHTPIAAFLTRFALRRENVKIIYTAHGFHFFKGGLKLNWLLYYPLERIAAHWTDKIITINNEDFERANKFNLKNNGKVELVHGVGIDPNKYIINDFNRDAYRESLGVSKNDFMLLILADLNRNKNHKRVIQAVKEINKKNIKIKVICAGEGPLKNKLLQVVDKYNLQNSIKFLGFRSDVKELVNSSDCVGLFSMREGLPKSLMEGMCCGKPLIASDIRGCRDLVKNKNIGEIINPKDYKSIIKGLERIYTNNYNSNLIKKEANKYSIDKVLKELEDIYRRLE